MTKDLLSGLLLVALALGAWWWLWVLAEHLEENKRRKENRK